MSNTMEPNVSNDPNDLSENALLGNMLQGIRRHMQYSLGCDSQSANNEYNFRATAFSVRDRIMHNWLQTRQRLQSTPARHVHYLSLEFLMGRSLNNAVMNLGLEGDLRSALVNLGLDLEDIVEQEHDAGLGNGGLGRLAACFLDSCANLRLPVAGYGIRYEYGMFKQSIEKGRQIEAPDHWLRDGNLWEVERHEDTKHIQFYGRTERYVDEHGRPHSRWVETQDILAVPFDMPIPGHDNGTVNTLRLWKATATDEFDLGEFNAGDYTESVADKNTAEQISMVLYPNDASENGKELRLKQQYFLVSSSIQDVLKDWVGRNGADFTNFAAENCFQLNDTHPACAVPELMRLLMDQYLLGWDEAWKITSQCMAYTNHTLLPEALERWSVSMFDRLLPRLLEIVYEINERFLGEVAERFPGDSELIKRVSIVEEGHDPHLRMAYLAIVGSYSVNGVAQLHTDLLKQGLFSDFHKIWPSKINNKTNGVTQRRWLSHCNPGMRNLLNETIGTGWTDDLEQLSDLAPYADDENFLHRWKGVKQTNKERLATYVKANTGISIDSSFMIDVQVKRIHEYKRQLMNILHVIHLYDRILRGDTEGMVPRCVLLGGKAAPGYHIAKLIIRFANSVFQVINDDPRSKDHLRCVFFPDYRVSAMEMICPGTELSEQISTAGKEASGTGNMKFMMNGALTIGTLDGANIEIREKAGAENFFLFGLNAPEVAETRRQYDPNAIIAADSDLQRIMELIEGGRFNQNHPGVFGELVAGMRNPNDQWLTIADLRSFIDAQQRVNEAYKDSVQWNRMSVLNTANSGWFSSDRTIQQYADEIWQTQALPRNQG